MSPDDRDGSIEWTEIYFIGKTDKLFQTNIIHVNPRIMKNHNTVNLPEVFNKCSIARLKES